MISSPPFPARGLAGRDITLRRPPLAELGSGTIVTLLMAQHSCPFSFLRKALCIGLIATIAATSGCVNPRTTTPAVDPDVARAEIARRLPATVKDPSNWAGDIFAAFESLQIAPTPQNICAVVAVTQQESTFQVNPSVPNLPKIAWSEIDSRAARYNIPKFAVRAALQLDSPDGKSYAERIDKATTEKALSDVFEDFIGMVPLGKRLFADWNPVRTGGPMQVSIAYAEKHSTRDYPYPISTNIRREVFTRRGGMYFGIAHLLGYEAAYDDMLYRFADFNAGHYASRNAAFQNAVSVVSKTKIALDGDLVLHGSRSDEPSNTELAIRKVAERIDLSDADIRDDIEQGDSQDFESTRTFKRVFALAEKERKTTLPRAMLPRIRLESAKITRKLTTEWFANRVNERYRQCLARGTG